MSMRRDLRQPGEWTTKYQKEQQVCIQGQINEINDTMLGIRCVCMCVCVCVCAYQWISLSTLARNQHKEPACEISLETRRTREGRPQRRRHLAEGTRRDQSTKQVSQEMRVEQRGDQSTEVSIACSFMRVFARVHTHVSSQNAQKVLPIPPTLALGADRSPCLFVCSFLLPFRLCFANL